MPQTKSFVLKAGVPPILADKIRYFADPRFQSRLLAPPQVRSILVGEAGADWLALSDEVRSLRAELGILAQALPPAKPMSDEEIVDPSRIPEEAVFNFGDVEIDLAGLSDDEIRTWTIAHIDRQVVGASGRSSAMPV